VLKEGDKAPDFELETDDPRGRGRISLKDFVDKTLVLYFYPRDSTPGCTREAQAFSAARGAIEMAGGAVVGVSRDSVKSHCTFREKYGLSIPLASDPDLQVHRAYGAWGEKVMYGRKVEGCIRSTFIIKDGHVAKAYPFVKVDGHADAVLQAIGEIAHGPSSRHIPTIPPPGRTSRAGIRAKEIGRAVKKSVAGAAKKTAKKVAAAVKKTAKKVARPAPKRGAPKRPKKGAKKAR